jgi:hypothetical protein
MDMNMNMPNSGSEGQESRLAGVVRGAVVCLLMAGAVLVGSGMNRQGAVAADATPETTAPAATDEARIGGYFPAQFPAPEGAPEAPIATF